MNPPKANPKAPQKSENRKAEQGQPSPWPNEGEGNKTADREYRKGTEAFVKSGRVEEQAQKAAEASLCAHDQDKFWQFHDEMFLDQKNLTVDDLKSKAAKLSLNAATFSGCLDSGKYAGAVRDSIAEGSSVGVDGTPALFINGRYLGGNQPYDAIAKIIDDELLRAGK